ncbi:MAG: hypothetical protein IPP72_01465 [Chitinophagaceae bacterium]|nr:hypothetical protein [Chitinophagaceae bacterium]
MQQLTASRPATKTIMSWMINTVVVFIAVFSSFTSFSQSTTLISAAGDGGFEGASLAANNWTAVNAATDAWVNGTASPNPGASAGTKAAYVTTDGGTTWNYSQLSTILHLYYQTVTVPVGQTKAVLNFKWKVGGEGTTTSDWDNMKVFFVPTATAIPAQGTAVSSTFQVSGPGAVSGMYKLNSTSYNAETIIFTAAPGTYRLCFSWKSDVSDIVVPPAAIDEVNLVTYAPSTITSAATGNWTDAATWVGSVPPAAADNAVIDAGHTVTLNTTGLSITNLTVNGTGVLNYSATPTSFTVLGNTQVNSGGTVNVFQGTTGKTLILNGNLTNDGIIDISVGTGTAGNLSLISTNAQTLSGTGTFNTGVIRNLTFNNTNSATSNISWGFNNISIPGTLTFTAGRVNLNSNTISSGSSTPTAGTVSWTSGGFSNGSYRKWLATTSLPTTLPSTTSGNWPFAEGTNNRNFQIASSTLSTGGSITVTHTNGAGLATIAAITDGVYSINRQTNANWSVTTSGITGGTYIVNMNGEGAFTTAAAPGANFPRVIQGATTVGTHASGTGTTVAPVANRTAIPAASFLGTAVTYRIGINAADAGVLSVQSGPWEDGATWSTGVAPLSTENVTIAAGHTVTVNAAAAVANTVFVSGTLTVSGNTLSVTAGTTGTGVTMGNVGTVNISGGTLTVGTGATRFSTFATGSAITSTLNISSGTLTVNGNINIQSPATFIQSGGTINVDGNAAGVTGNSVPAATSIFAISTINLTVTGGNLNIIDPHASITAATTSAAFRGNASVAANFGTGHTTTFGDGVSTDAGGSTNGFLIYTFAGSSYTQLGTVVVNGSASGANRHVLTSSSVGILGNLTINNTNGEFRIGASNLFLRGNLTVNAGAAFTAPSGSVLGLADFSNGSTSAPLAVTTAQTIGGTGAFRNNTTNASSTASFTSLLINNTNVTGVSFSGNALLTNGVTFSGTAVANSGTVSGTLTLTAGNVNTGGGTFILGVTGTNGTLAYTAGGFTGGSIFARQFSAAGAGTTITTGTAPSSTGAGTYPFISSTGANRFFYLNRPVTTGGTQGAIAVTYTDGAGFSTIAPVTDGAYTVDSRTNSSWQVTTPAVNAITFGAGTGTFDYAINGTGLYTAVNTNARLMQAASFTGTFQAGTLAPIVQRTAITAANFITTNYIGINASEIPVVSAQTGPWESTSTWQGGILPAASSNVTILSTHVVTVNAASAAAGSVVVNAGAGLTVSGNTLTIGASNNNNLLSNSGTLTVSGGTLAVNGNINSLSGSTFAHTGGNIVVDGNQNGNPALSVASGTPIVWLQTNNVTLSGGTLTIVDPHAGTSTSDDAFRYTTTLDVAAATGHTLQLGDGVSIDSGRVANTNGFSVEPFASSGRLIFGNFTVNTVSQGNVRNRFVAHRFSTVQILGDLTVTSGRYRISGTVAVAGNIINNGEIATTGTLALQSGSGSSTSAASANAQSVSGSGIFRNNLPAATIVAGGTGYTNGDILTLAGGTFTSPATFIVTGNTSGAITSVANVFPGTGYTVEPGIGEAVSGGTGTGATLTATNIIATANFASLTVNNSNVTGITFTNANSLLSGINAGTVSGTYTQTAGLINTGSNAFVLGGGTAALGTLSYTAGGFPNGSSFGRWYSTATGQATIVDAANPTGNTGRYPFVSGANNRSVYISQTSAPTTGGVITVKYNDAATISIPSPTFTDGGYTINRLTDANWVISQTGITGAPDYAIAAVGAGIYSSSNANTRLSKATAVLPGTHIAGSTSPILPVGQRVLVSLADLASTVYLGYNSNDIPFVSVATGNWQDGTTWNRNPDVPDAASSVTITAGHTVTVGAVSVANTLTVSSTAVLDINNNLTVGTNLVNNGTVNAIGGTATFTGTSLNGISNALAASVFTVNGGTVNVGITDNSFADRRFANSGTLTVSSGALNIYGNLSNSTTSTFTQSGGTILIDGNAGANAANSVPSGTYLLSFNSPASLTSVNLTGGTLTIVDPHANTSTSDYAIYMTGSPSGSLNVTAGHTLVFGDGASVDAGGNTNGFYVNTWAGTTGLPFGNVIINGPSANNRHVSGQYQQPILGDLTINSGGESRIASVQLNGNLNINSGGTFTSTGSLLFVNSAFLNGSSFVFNPVTSPQSLNNAGTIQNLTTAATANLTSLYFNNNSAGGVTLNTPLTVSGSLELVNGKVNTSSANLLRLGTATAAGTLTLTGAGSATNYINGPFARTFAASRTATGATGAIFPVGTASTYLPISADPVTNAGGAVILTAEAFGSNSGTPGAGVSNLSTNRWQLLPSSGAANLTSSFITLGDAAIGATNKILQAPSAAGVYGAVNGSSTYTAGTIDSLGSTAAITPYTGYFAYGDLTPCTAPASQPSALVVSNLTSVSFNGSFTAAAPAPTGYLVVRYLTTDPVTPPTDLSTYTVGGTLGAGSIVSFGNSLSFTQSSLTAGTSYIYYFYSFNNSGCAGPAYNTTSPYSITVTTCAAATGIPGTPTVTNITTGGFDLTWTASSTPSVDYIVDVATDAAFTSFVAGYNALNVGTALTTGVSGLSAATTYYARVRAVTNPGGCTSDNSGTLTTATACNSITGASLPFAESFDAATIPACWSTSVNGGTNNWVPDDANDGVPAARTGARFAGVSWTSSSNNSALLFSPVINFTATPTTQTRINVWIYRNIVNGLSTDRVSFYANTTQSLTGATSLIDISLSGNIAPTVASSGWYNYIADIPLSYNTGGDFYIIALGNTTTSFSSYGIGFDDFVLENTPPPCAAPANPATSLNLVPSSSAVSGSFTAAAGADGYLVVRTPGVTTPTNPVDGTTYSAASSALGGAIEAVGWVHPFLTTGLPISTQYTYTVFSYNNTNCTGGPVYLSTALSGTVTTLAAQNYTSVQTGLWSDPATWGTAVIPSINDNVTIDIPHTVTIDIAAVANSLNIDGTLRYEAATARTLTVATDVINGGQFTTALTGTQTGHILSVGGSISTYNTLLDFNTNGGTAGGTIIFTGAGNSQFNCFNGGVTNLRNLTVNKGTGYSNIVETNNGSGVQGTFTAAPGFLTLINGTLKLTAPISPNTLFSTAGYTIPATAGLWLNNASITVTGQAASATNNGLLRITAGDYNVGTGSSQNLNSGAGAVYTLEGGSLTVAGSFTSTNDITYTQTGTLVTVSKNGNSSTQSFGFTSTAVGNSFSVSGSSRIVIQTPNSAGTTNDYQVLSGTQSITGGTLEFGNASTAAAAVFNLRAATGLVNTPAIIVDATTNTKTLTIAGSGTGNLQVNGSLTIGTGSSLIHNASAGQTIDLKGNFVNNGAVTLGGSGSTNNTISFTGTGAQTYSGTGSLGTVTITYPVLNIKNAAGVTFSQTGANAIVARVNLVQGAVTGSALITLGVGGVSAATIQRGGDVLVAAGSFDVAPTFNVGSGGLAVRYETALSAVTTGVEIPSGRTIASLFVNNTNNVTLSGGALSSTSVNLSAGQFITSSSNLLTVTGTTTGSVARTTGYVNGPVVISLPASATGTYLLPVGKTAYAGFELVSPTTSAAATVQAEYFTAASGGTGINGIQAAGLYPGYWSTSSAGGFTSSVVRVTSPITLNTGTDALAKSDGLVNGNYDLVGTTAITTSSVTSDAAQTSLGFYALGLKAVPMTYVSSTTTQVTGNIYTGQLNQAIIGVQVVTAGNFPALTFNNITFNSNGSTDAATDIDQATLYFTGNSATFNASTPVGSAQPGFALGSPFIFSQDVTLLPGTNYFWLAYDIAALATVNNVVDAEVDETTPLSLNITDGNSVQTGYTPTVIAPAGNRTIKTLLNGDYTVGPNETAPNFTKLTDAIAVLNSVGVGGPVRFLLQADYTSATETFPLVINSYFGASAINNVKILPNTGVTAAITASLAAAANSVFKLNGADFVTIDGSNNGSSSRNLTITNNNTAASSVIWNASAGGAGNGANSNTIKNLNIVGGSATTSGIYGISSSSTASLTTAAADNDNLTVQNNNIGKVYIGISALSSSTAGLASDGLLITGNSIGNVTAANSVTSRGIEVSYSTSPTISVNTIFNLKTTGSLSLSGIDLGAGVVGGSVVRNSISGIYSTSTSGWGAYGINFSSSTATTNVVVANNFISDIQTANYSTTDLTFNGYGIRIAGGTNLKIYNNSINFYGAVTSGTSAGSSANLVVTSTAVTGLDLRNNLFVNTQTFGTAGSFAYNVRLAASVTIATSNYNGYAGTSGTNTTYRVGITGTTARATLTNWQAFTLQDANSKSALPVFLAANDLHLTTASINTTNYAGTGVNIAAVTTDYDNETRANPPGIGADELVPCAGAIGGVAVAPATTTFCGSSSAGLAITASGYSSALNGSYQWESSTTSTFDIGTITTISGANNPASYTISPAVTSTTYFRLKVTCGTGLGTDYSNVITITVNGSPTAVITPVGGSVFCTGTPVQNTITLNGSTNLVSPAPQYQWKLDGVDLPGETTASYAVPYNVVGAYRLIVTNSTSGCKDSSTVTISSAPRPTATATASPNPLCLGASLTLTSTGTTGVAGYGVSAITYAPATDPGGATITSGDDAVSSAQTIPFSFNFYGTNYTSVYAYTNGFIQLGTSSGSTSIYAQTLPTAAAPYNLIAGVWSDLNVTGAAAVRSYTTGVTPNRVFTVHYSNVPYYSASGNNDFYIQLYETSNIVEVHIGEATGVPSLGGSNKTTGLQNSTGSSATSPSGRNAVNFQIATTAKEAWRFSPTSITGYSWTGPDGFTAAVQNPAAFATTALSAGVYTVTVTENNGCTGQGSTAAVVVNPLPTVSADSAAFVLKLATPQTTTLPYSATETPTTYSIVWDAAAQLAGFVNVTNAPLPLPAPATPIQVTVPPTAGLATYNGTLSVKNANTCESTGDAFTLIIADNGNPVWTGNTSSDWNDGTNWSSGLVPSPSANVTITKTGSFNPVLTGDITIGGTLQISSGNTVTIGGNTLTVTGGILSNTGTLAGSNTSNLVLGAASAVRFASGGTLKNLTINAGTATLQSALDITGGTGGVNSGTFGTVTVANGAVLASGGFLTFKSNASGTARLAAGSTSGGYVTGDVTVERYIPGNARRAWRMLSVPTKGSQKIKQAWQEGGIASNFNPTPGYGLVIPGNFGPYASLIAAGFDEYAAGASIQSWNTATSAWTTLTATQGAGSTGNIENFRGYAIYVRGDRTQTASGSVLSTTSTTLRTKGTLYLGDQAAVAVGPNKFDMFGNNFVSAIDFTGLNKVGLNNVFYIWDPKVPVAGANTAYGGYVTFSGTNGFAPVPATGSYTAANTVIESGQSFFVVGGAAGGTLAIPESAKVASSRSNVFRPSTIPQKLKANLFIVAADNSTMMADANVSVFDNAYSNAVDGDDAIKLTNAGENFAIYREAKNLVVEGRQAITEYDTTFFNIWNIQQSRQYRIELIAEQMNVPGLSAYLQDNFLGTNTPLDLAGTTNYDFTVTSTVGSGVSNRFKVVYRQVQLAPLPVTFISFGANKVGAAVKVDWKVAAERGIQRYEVERSADGRSFVRTGTVTATGNSSVDLNYSWMDATPLSAINYYRIKSVGVAGEIKYTNIAKVSFGEVKPAFAIAPNPVEGSVINLQFKNQAQGRYNVRLLSNAGQVVFTTVAEHAGGNSTQLISLPATIARGAYQLEIISPDKTTEVQHLFINTLK